MGDDYITKIVVDLSAWTDHYPTGCIMYHYNTEIDSAYCDNTDEFIEYIDGFKDKIIKHVTEMRFVFDSYDIDNETALECAREVREHFYELIGRK